MAGRGYEVLHISHTLYLKDSIQKIKKKLLPMDFVLEMLKVTERCGCQKAYVSV